MEPFASQHGAATDAQVRAAGVSLRQQNAWIRAGLWRRAAPGVITVGGMPATWQQRAITAVLGSGRRAMLSHGSAARLHGFDGYQRYEPLHVTVPPGARCNRVGVVQHVLGHRIGTMPTVIDGIACAPIPLTLVGCCAIDRHDRVGKAVDDALRKGASPEWLESIARDLRTPGRSGPGRLLALLDERTERRLPRSWLQRLAKRLLAVDGRRWVDEYPIFGRDGRLLAELDLADPASRIGVECQSWTWHGTPAAQRADSARRRTLRRMGWEIVEVWWSDLDRIDDVMATIAAIRAERATHSTTDPACGA